MMADRQWPVTFSIGALTYQHAPKTVEEMMKKVDIYLYQAKNAGKNVIFHDVIL